MQRKKQILQIKKAKQMEERLHMSDQGLLVSDVHILKFHTGKTYIHVIIIIFFF